LIVEISMNYSDIRESLAASNKDLRARFEAGESIVALVHARATVIDGVLQGLWRDHIETTGAALIAVGGFGRGELHPHSDVDVMLLVPDQLPEDGDSAISAFITALWDIGLDIGHSVRTIEQCREEAAADLTVATTLNDADGGALTGRA
jgi:[protein-PII] uridylyltransferase